MNKDFLVAIFIGLLILLIFWLVTLFFIFFRKRPDTKLSPKLIFQSLSIFAFCFLILALLSLADSIYA